MYGSIFNALQHVCMFNTLSVCMYICIYVCVYVCAYMRDGFHMYVCMYVYRRAVEAEHRRLTKIKNRANRKSVAHVQELEKKLMGKVLGRHTAKIHAHGDHYLQSGMGIRLY